jgi:23S rRNA (cytidine1920-2'-O)/16S rRNA (cytidine1409-2'-O)-methyltransferase
VVKRIAKVALKKRLLEEGLFESDELASKAILAGLVRVDGVVVDKIGASVSSAAQISVRQRKAFVSRAALKLEGALNAFNIDPRGRISADVGACTGGFTEVLLQRGAERVFAIDVGYGDLDWKVRSDPRVTVMERTNARFLESLPLKVSLVVIDLSFISLDKILPVVVGWFDRSVPGGEIVALIKPQFEAKREEIGSGGIVTDERVHLDVCARIEGLLPGLGLVRGGLEPSPILGAEGNREFLLWAKFE